MFKNNIKEFINLIKIWLDVEGEQLFPFGILYLYGLREEKVMKKEREETMMRWGGCLFIKVLNANNCGAEVLNKDYLVSGALKIGIKALKRLIKTKGRIYFYLIDIFSKKFVRLYATDGIIIKIDEAKNIESNFNERLLRKKKQKHQDPSEVRKKFNKVCSPFFNIYEGEGEFKFELNGKILVILSSVK